MKKSMSIQFRSYDMIERFSKEIADIKGEFDLVSGRKTVDAKSFLGIFSLDLSKPIDLNIHADGNVDDILAALDAYIIK